MHLFLICFLLLNDDEIENQASFNTYFLFVKWVYTYISFQMYVEPQPIVFQDNKESTL